MVKYLLEMDEPVALKLSELLAAYAGQDGYAGLVELNACEACSCVVTDIQNHYEEAHSA